MEKSKSIAAISYHTPAIDRVEKEQLSIVWRGRIICDTVSLCPKIILSGQKNTNHKLFIGKSFVETY